MKILKVMKFEINNILRSRWIIGYMMMSALLSGGFSYLSANPSKVLVSLSLVLPILVPLVCIAYSTLHWYYNERFTVLLLIQPISRSVVLWSRYLALSLSLSASAVLGIVLPFVLRWQWPTGLGLLILNLVLLTFIFVGVALWISTKIEDRLKGIGLALGVWIYLSLVHDGLLLILLILLRETPMDLAAGVFSSLNPIALSRVTQLMYFDQPLLLGHTGALTKQILISWKGFTLTGVATGLWLTLPLWRTHKAFQRKNL